MNSRHKLVKMILVTLLVARASLVTTRLVNAGMGNRTYTDPDLVTFNKVGTDSNTVETIFLNRSGSSSWDVFKQYYALIEQMEVEHNSVLVIIPLCYNDDSWILFEQYDNYAR